MNEIHPELDMKKEIFDRNLKVVPWVNEKHKNGQIIQFKTKKGNLSEKARNQKPSRKMRITGPMTLETLKKFLVGLGLAVTIAAGTATIVDSVGTIKEAEEQVAEVNKILKEGTQPVVPPEADVDILDKIQVRYNMNVEEDKQIRKEDLMVVKEKFNDGQIYKIVNENGEEQYFQDYLAGVEKAPEDAEWIYGNKIKDAYVVLNKADQTAITGVVEMTNGKIAPLQVNTMTLDIKNVIKGNEHYIHLRNDEKNLSQVKEELSKLREERKAKEAEEQEKENEGLEPGD